MTGWTVFWLWMTGGVVFLILELAAPGTIMACQAAGCVAAGIAGLLGAPLWLQLLSFAALSILATFILRPLLERRTRTRGGVADRMIGRRGQAGTALPAGGVGRVIVDGVYWNATCTDNVARGEAIEIRRVDGTLLHVVPCGNRQEEE